MSIGTKGMMVAAKTIALTAMDIFENPKTVEAAKAELEERGVVVIVQHIYREYNQPADTLANEGIDIGDLSWT